MAYNVETIVAEKLETIISRGVTNTRSKDFYDLYALSHSEKQNINFDKLKLALTNTAKHRGTLNMMSEYKIIFNEIQRNVIMNQSWEKYQNEFMFAKYIKFDEACQAGIQLMDRMNWGNDD